MGGEPIGRAECINDTTSGRLVWNITEYLIDCGTFRGTSDILTDIIQKGVTNETVIEALEDVVVVSDTDLNEEDIANIAAIIRNSTNLQSGDPQITSLTTTIISDFAEMDEEELYEVESNTGAISQILESFEEQLNNVDVSEGEMFVAFEMNIAVQVTSVDPTEFSSGLTVSASSTTSSDLRQSNITLDPGDSSTPVLMGTRVTIPPSILNDLSSELVNEPRVRVALSVFRTPALFSSRRLRETNAEQSVFNRSVNSLIVGLTLGGRKVMDLREDIVFRYTPLQSGFQDPNCVFWEFSDVPDWSSIGCRRMTSSGREDTTLYDETEEIVCSCSHLTNFAVLMDVRAERVEALRIISIIGCAISITCLIITLITYLSNKNLHTHQSQKIYICLCATLLGLYVTFVIMSSLDRQRDYEEVQPVPCGILAALVHFFTLSSLAWMGVEGFNTYLIVVKVFDAYIPRFMLNAGLVAWGISGLIVLLTGFAARANYASSDYCFLQRWPLIGGLLIPMAIILIMNIVIFSLVIRRLIKSSNVAARRDSSSGTDRKATIERVRNAVGVLLLLGLTWITGYLTLADTSSSQVTQTLFIVFNSLQGFFIFLLYCVRNPVVRAYWAKKCGCAPESTSSTGANLGTSKATSSSNTRKLSSSVNFTQAEKGDDPTSLTLEDGYSAVHDNPTYDVSEVEIGEDPTSRWQPNIGEGDDPAYDYPGDPGTRL